MSDDPLNQVDFDDPQADWRSFHVEVQVIEVFAGDLTAGDKVTLGLAFGSGLPASTVEDGLMSMGQIVAFTRDDDFVVPYDSSLVPIVHDGALLSPVQGDRVPFPVIAGSMTSLVTQIDTLQELRVLSRQ